MSSVVCNASPLIVMAKTNLLDLMPRLFEEIFVPQAVVNEIRAGPPDDPANRALGNCPWLKTVLLDPRLSPLAVWQLGRGESEVIEYARLHPGVEALLDDRAARRAAARLGLIVRGTLSVAALGANRGYVRSFSEAVNQLRAAGLFVNDAVVNEAARGLEAGS
jgi:predicted nucleic acid-binding protein